MILAAGEGTRLRPLTDRVPKPMVPIAGRPILEHAVRLLVRHGVCDITVNLHHCPEAVTTHFGGGERWGAAITYSYEPTLLGTAGALLGVPRPFAESFLVVYGDNLLDCDLDRFVDGHRTRGAVATVALFEREDPSSSGVAELDADDRVRRFVEKPAPGTVSSRWVSAGLIALEPEALAWVPAEGPSDLGRDVLPALIAAGRPVYGFRGPLGLWWIDTPADHRRVEELARRGEVRLA